MAVVDEMVWMRHDESGGVALFPKAAAEAWGKLGWAPCDDPPPDPDPALVEHVPMAVALAKQAEAEAAQSTSDTEDTNDSEEE